VKSSSTELDVIGIMKVGTYLPPGRQDNIRIAELLGFDAEFLHDKLGVMAAARKGDDQETSDLCVAAFQDLERRSGLDRSALDLIVVVTQNPDGHGLPHTSAVVHQKLHLGTSCFAFDLSLGCSGFVAGLAVVKGFMQVTGAQRAVLMTADPYSKILDPQDRNTIMIFGDGATATLIGNCEHWNIGAFDLGTDGEKVDALRVLPTGKLHMNGRAVFDFCAVNVPKSVQRALSLNGLRKENIDSFLFHPGSKYIVDIIARRLGLGEVPFRASDYGNTVSSSIPMMLADLDPATERTVLMAGFGVGLGWATTVLKGL
jgi:3-oxoacyl-[acyl-carrier-protein] synthase-3